MSAHVPEESGPGELTAWNADLIRRRLAELQAQDPDYKIFGARRHRHRLGPRLSAREVAAVETEIGIELPASFRTFLTEVGNGGAGPSYGLYGLEEAIRLDAKEFPERPPDFYTTPFPHPANWDPPPGDQPDDYEEARWVTGSLALAEFGCGAFYRLVLNDGQVWFDDRCSDAGIVREGDFSEWYLSWLERAHLPAP